MGLSCEKNLATAGSNGTINFQRYGIRLKSTAQRWILYPRGEYCLLNSALNKESTVEYGTTVCTCTSLYVLLCAGCEFLEMYMEVHHPPDRGVLLSPARKLPRHAAVTAWLWFVLPSAILQSNALTARLQRRLAEIVLLIAFVPFYKNTKVALDRWWQRRRVRKYRWLTFRRSLIVGLLQDSLHI